VPEFEEVLNRLQPGQIADPVVTPLRRAPDPAAGAAPGHAVASASSAKSPATVLREKKLDEAFVTWVQEVRGRAYVEYREPPQ
jgi:peptidyl-prolyl cis-trans isomerase SurA